MPRVTAIPKYEAVRTTIEGHRVYATPLGLKPSVTTILRDDSKFAGWRKYKGEKAADEILQRASQRGTWTHDGAEQFLTTGEHPPFHFSYQPFYNSLRPFLEGRLNSLFSLRGLCGTLITTQVPAIALHTCRVMGINPP